MNYFKVRLKKNIICFMAFIGFLNLIIAQNLYSENNKNSELISSYSEIISKQTKKDSIIKYATLLEKSAKKIKDRSAQIKALQAKSYAYILDRNFTTSLKFELEALNLLDKKKQPYLYYNSIYNIAMIQLYMQQFKEAIEYAEQSSNYFNSFKNKSHIYGYLNSKRLEAICYYYLKNSTTSLKKLSEGYKEMHRLDEKELIEEKAYYKLTESMNNFYLQNYSQSKNDLFKALPEIKKNNDYANEYLIYLYLGQIEWKLKNKENAIKYFKKIDNILINKYINTLETTKVYTYLIDYYKEKNDLKQQLFYTNRLLEITNYVQRNQSDLSKSFLNNSIYLQNNLLQNKAELTNQIINNQKKVKNYIIALFLAALIILGLIHFYFKKNKDNKIIEEEKDLKKEKKIHHKKEDVLPDKIINDFNNHIINFETTLEFLNPDVNLNTLSEKWNTNRSYLSKYFNNIKGETFNNYINTIRINYALQKITENKKYRKYSIDALSIEFGFSKRRHFSDVFIKKTGMTPSAFIDKLNQKEIL